MADVTFIGAGTAVRTCSDILRRAGFSLRHAFNLEELDRGPIILGEVQGSFGLARQIVESGRHLLIASPSAFPPDRLSLLLENRKRAQALFIWNERRHHPGYRLVHGLIESDASWRPRLIRQETLSREAATGGLLRWRLLESIALLHSLSDSTLKTVSAAAAANAMRSAPDYLSLTLKSRDLNAFVSVGLGEINPRRETLIAAGDRKAFVDELNQGVPLRLIDEDPGHTGEAEPRRVSCPPPTMGELARRQCLAFLEATNNVALAQTEATLWARSLAVLQAMEQSLLNAGAPAEIDVPSSQPRFRLLPSRQLPAASPPIPA